MEEMKLCAELTMSLHQLDTASITEGGLGRRVMARSCREERLSVMRESYTCLFVRDINIQMRVQPLTAELSHLPPLDLRFRWLAGTTGAAGLLLQQLDIRLLAGCREREGGRVG